MRDLVKTFLLFTLLGLFPLRAEVLVLVHGYLGSENSWVEPGIIEILEKRGRQLAGTYSFAEDGVLLSRPESSRENPCTP